MSPDQYQQVRALFVEACRVPREQWAGLLETRGCDDAVRAEVRSLLEHDDSVSFMCALPLEEVLREESGLTLENWPLGRSHAAPQAGLAHALRTPERIGRFRILECIGAGGMGVVYRAEQEHPRRAVALKLLSPVFLTPERLRRFEFEAQVLGQLQHPGIACIHEAGQADIGGQSLPYFAMELVEGCSLTEYARERRPSVRERLELLILICEAVQHAHQKGVIHRDLKPRNILVGADGKPKILDFGIARALNADLELTTQQTSGELLGTLPYMSPEQVSGRSADVDTRSDVYALGVLAYELLSGRLPHDVRARGMAEVLQAIRHQEPPPLGALDRALRGDLEIIVARALEKDRARRYASASELAADLRRHLQDEPIAARRPSTLYQLQKFARRNRALVGGIAATFLVLVAGVAATSWQTVVATAARNRAQEAEKLAERRLADVSAARDDAQQEADKATQIQGFLQNMLSATEEKNANVTVREVLDDAATRLESELTEQREVRAALLHTIGAAYMALGLDSSSRPLLQTAVEIRRAALPQDDLDLADSILLLALAQGYSDAAISEALTLCDEAIAIRSRRLGEGHALTVDARQYRAQLLWNRQDHDATWNAMVDAALSLLVTVRSEQFPAGIAQTIETAKELAAAGDRAALSRHLWQYRLDSSEQLRQLWSSGQHEEAFEYIRSHYRPFMDTPLLASYLPFWQISMSAWMRSQGESSDVLEPILREALALARRVVGEESLDVAQACTRLGGIRRECGDLDEAETLLKRGLELFTKLAGEQHPDVGIALSSLGEVHVERGVFETAEAMFVRSRAIFDGAGIGDGPEAAESWSGLAVCAARREEVEEARRLLRDAERVLLATRGPLHPATRRAQERLSELDGAP